MGQGQFGFDKLFYLPEFDLHVKILEWDNCINSLATAVNVQRCNYSFTKLSE
jgi:starch synthase